MLYRLQQDLNPSLLKAPITQSRIRFGEIVHIDSARTDIFKLHETTMGKAFALRQLNVELYQNTDNSPEYLAKLNNQESILINNVKTDNYTELEAFRNYLNFRSLDRYSPKAILQFFIAGSCASKPETIRKMKTSKPKDLKPIELLKNQYQMFRQYLQEYFGDTRRKSEEYKRIFKNLNQVFNPTWFVVVFPMCLLLSLYTAI